MIQELGDTASSVGKILQEKTGKSFTQLMSEGKNLYEVLAIVKDSCNGNEDAFNNLWSSTEAGLSAMSLLSNNGQYFNETLNDMANSAGLCDEAYQEMANTAEFKMNKALNNLKNSFITLGQGATPAIEKLSEMITNLAKFLGSLDPVIVENIAKFGAMTLAIGAVGKVVGSAVSGLGTFLTIAGSVAKVLSGAGTATGAFTTALSGAGATASGLGSALTVLSGALAPIAIALTAVATVAYTTHEYFDMMGQSVTTSREQMSFMEKALADLTGQTTFTNAELEKMGLKYKDFNSNISEGFKNKVEEMTLDIHDFGMTLSEINIDGVIDDAETSALQSRVDNALSSCLKVIESRNQELQSGLQKAFSADGVIDETESSLLEYWSNRGSKEKEEATKLQSEINSIIAKARAEGRALTPEEVSAIEDYYAQIKQIELECSASNQYEIEYASQEFHNRINTLDADNSKKLLKQRYDDYKEQQIATKTNYDTLISMAKEGYENLSEEDKRHVDESVARLEKQKEDELRVNQEKYDADLQYAEEHNQNLGLIWNKYRGEEVARQDVAYYEDYEKMRSHYQDIGNITESGYKQVYNTATGTWDDIYVSIDKTTGELKGVYDMNTGNTVAMTKKDKSALQDEVAGWQQTAQGVLANCITMGTAYSDTAGNIKNESGQIIGKITQVRDANGNLKNSIVDVNGHPLHIGENTGSVISRLQETARNANALNGKRSTITIETKHIDSYYVTGKATQHTRGGSWTMATGTESSNEGLHLTNEPYAGWELINQPSGVQAMALSSLSDGDYTYLEKGTQVLNHLASVESMRKDIKAEVTKQLGNAISKKDIDRIVEAIRLYGGGDVEVNNNIEINNSSDVDMEKTNKGMEQLLKEQLRRYGKIK